MDFVTLIPSSLSAAQNNATYSCTLTNLWSAETHPVLYESVASSAHWSRPILATHNANYSLWAPDTLASPGIELVAEMGVTAELRREILEEQINGLVGEMVVGSDQFNALNEPQTFQDIRLTSDFPFLSTISMVAPSPDWFSGIPAFRPIDDIDGVWYDFFEVATYPWDAGTETGDTYSLSNAIQDPENPITRLTVDTVPENGILLDPTGTIVPPMALWSCTLYQSPSVTNVPLPEEDVLVSDQQQEEEIIALIEDEDLSDQNQDNITTVSNEEENNEDIGFPSACLRYFDACTEDSDCCSNRCSRSRCSSRSRGQGRDESVRIVNQGVGGAAGRRRGRYGGTSSLDSSRGTSTSGISNYSNDERTSDVDSSSTYINDNDRVLEDELGGSKETTTIQEESTSWLRGSSE